MKKILGLLLLIVTIFSCGDNRECCVLPIETSFSFEGDANGCASFYVYKEDNNQHLHLYVEGDRTALELDLTEKEFTIPNEQLKVEILQFDGEIGQYACDDVANDQGEVIDTWTAINGLVTIQIVEDSISIEPWETTFKMTVKLKDIQLQNKQKELGELKGTEFKKVFVGWLPG